MPVTDDMPPTISDHTAHRGHKLKRVGNDGRFFICDGCMAPGAGTRYRCEHERCNFDLHTCCAVAPDTVTHPLLGDRVLVFLLEAPEDAITGGKKKHRVCCVACGEDVRGFVYHSFDDDDGLDLHPCCASLPEHAALRGERVSALQQEAPCPHDMTRDRDNNSG